MARSWRAFQPGYSPATYTPTGIKTLNTEELTREYSRVRREATERLRSFARSKDPAIRNSQLAMEKQGVYLTQAAIRATGEGRGLMEDLLLDAYRFIQSKRSTVSGVREIERKTVRSLQAAGYSLKEKDLKKFGSFMDWARDRRDSKKFGSGTMVNTYDLAKRSKISDSELKKHYSYYINQVQSGADHLTRWKK